MGIDNLIEFDFLLETLTIAIICGFLITMFFSLVGLYIYNLIDIFKKF